jgi:hypothetical protein
MPTTYEELGKLSAWLAMFAVLMIVSALVGIGDDRWIWVMVASGKWTCVASLIVLAVRVVARRLGAI